MDRSPSTVVCVSQLSDGVSAHLGAEATATRVLPVLCPLLVAPTINGKQFKDVMAVIQVMVAIVLLPATFARLASAKWMCVPLPVHVEQIGSSSGLNAIHVEVHLEENVSLIGPFTHRSTDAASCSVEQEVQEDKHHPKMVRGKLINFIAFSLCRLA